ncbi:MAG: 50S ribosomal protein L6 [Parachlamydiales bacterium]|jgi:large subunit ribosomal protein L6
MSRKGKQPIALPKGVEVNVHDGKISVKGPKGTLTQDLIDGISIKIEDGHILVEPDATKSDMGKFHGLYRSLISNMVEGTTKGFEKQLELIGVGYRATVQGHFLDLQLGFSHPTKLAIPQGIQVKVEKNIVTVTGNNKQEVGQYCASIRAVRPPEPYQGKGVRYKDEYVRRKQGKSSGKK